MGLQTTNRKPSVISKDHSDSESRFRSSTFVPIDTASVSLTPDAAFLCKMAPALTEPLSPTNKLSSSAASASPRPIAACPLQNNNNNNNNQNLNHNNNVETDSVNTNSNIGSNSITNSSTKEQSIGGVVGIAVNTAAAKGAFQLAFEQSVAIRNFSLGVNGEALSRNNYQMGPMCDTKSSQQSLSAANTGPLIKSKISQIDAETAAEIITSQFGDFPSDIEEAITAEIHLRNKKKLSEEVEARLSEGTDIERVVGAVNVVDSTNEDSAKDQHMDEHSDNILKCKEQAEPKNERAILLSTEESENCTGKDLKSRDGSKLKVVDIISVQELPPIKTDSTVTASEDDNIEERLKQLDSTDSTDDCPLQISQESGIPATPPRTPSAHIMAQLTPTSIPSIPTTVSVSSLTPQSTTSAIGGNSGHQKDFKDNEIDHDIEDDLLQVLKGFDSATGGDICDLAGFLSEYGMNYEDVNPPNAKDNPLKEVQVEIEKTQQTMQRRIDFLLRRLRKLQARYMSKQASEEISGLFEWSARTTKHKNNDTDQQLTFSEEKYHPVSTNTMRNVLKKIENVATNVQHIAPGKKQQQLYSNNSDPSAYQMEVVVPTYDKKVSEEIEYVSGLLRAEMRVVQCAMDSDATASSSGGESADEMVTYNNQIQDPLPISKRAAWRYSRDRAAIAARWSWLMSQISDLEFKIRQHTELHQQLRQLKGKVMLLNCTDANVGNCGTNESNVNGYRGILPGGNTNTSGYTVDTDLEAAIDATQESSQGACRTRAFQSNYFKKRKLFQTANVHTISKKAARPSTIKCGCQWPLHPCALCTGRPDPTAPRDLPDTMMMPQRVALLDPCFHPVLSFPEDILTSIFFEAITGNVDWQNRVVRSTAKAVMRGALAAQRAAEREEQRAVSATSGQITPNTSLNANTSNMTNTGKRKYTKRNHQDLHGGGSHSTTPLVANKLEKGSKKHHRHQKPDSNNHRKNNNSKNHHQKSSHQFHPQSVEQSNHRLAHSSSIYQHSKNNKIRKLSSASAAATLTQSGIHHDYTNSNLNPHNPNNQHQSYNNELNFLHCDDLDGVNTNGLMGPAPRSRASSPMHTSGHYKYERSLERKSRSSYDIDNIVIPYSVAAATRVEILPYKEIPTPKWRIIDYDTDNVGRNAEIELISTEEDMETDTSNKDDKKADGARKAENTKSYLSACSGVEEGESYLSPCGEIEENEEEDISDETMILRHERALNEERRKFQTFLKFPWSTRSRANRRIDSRAESSGANTPDPASPAPNTPSVAGDQDQSISSPFVPSAPLDTTTEYREITSFLSNTGSGTSHPSITSILNSASKRQERRRTVSTKKDKDDQRRSSTPDMRDLIPPYEPLVFPIPDDLFDSMLRMMPEEYHLLPEEDCQTLIGTSAVSAVICNGVSDNPNQIKSFASKTACDQKHNNNKTCKKISTEHVTGQVEDELAKSTNSNISEQNIIMAASPPFQSDPPTSINEVEYSSYICQNNLLGCSDTESVDSEIGDDDPNDPEWKEEEPE